MGKARLQRVVNLVAENTEINWEGRKFDAIGTARRSANPLRKAQPPLRVSARRESIMPPLLRLRMRVLRQCLTVLPVGLRLT
jgi:hypothetical protein